MRTDCDCSTGSGGGNDGWLGDGDVDALIGADHSILEQSHSQFTSLFDTKLNTIIIITFDIAASGAFDNRGC